MLQDALIAPSLSLFNPVFFERLKLAPTAEVFGVGQAPRKTLGLFGGRNKLSQHNQDFFLRQRERCMANKKVKKRETTWINVCFSQRKGFLFGSDAAAAAEVVLCAAKTAAARKLLEELMGNPVAAGHRLVAWSKQGTPFFIIFHYIFNF